MIVKYSQLPGISIPVLAPLIPVTLRNGQYEFSTFALIDSGATRAAISTVIADALHIPWNTIPIKMGYSVSGGFGFHLAENLEAEIFGHSFLLRMSVIEGVSPHKCILGQADIFQRAKITFEAYNREFDISFRRYN